MEAYDKLFLDPVVAKNPVNAVRYLETEIEYIRKDALLEWINEHRALHSGVTWNTLIDKINEL